MDSRCELSVFGQRYFVAAAALTYHALLLRLCSNRTIEWYHQAAGVNAFDRSNIEYSSKVTTYHWHSLSLCRYHPRSLPVAAATATAARATACPDMFRSLV